MNAKFLVTGLLGRARLIALALLVGTSPVLASELNLSLDVSQFQDHEDQLYFEIYYALPKRALVFLPEESGELSCQVVMSLQIHANDDLWASKLWKIEQTIPDREEEKNGVVVDLMRYLLEEPGRYTVTLYARDLNAGGQMDSVRVEFKSKNFADAEVELSDVELASDISLAEGENGIFRKSRYSVVPNPAGVYGEGVPNVFYYFEAYNLQDAIDGDRYKSVCYVKDAYDNIVEGLANPYRTKLKRSDASVELGMLNVTSLGSGRYTLVYGIADSLENVLTSREKSFYVFNPGVQVVASDIEASQPASDAAVAGLERLNEKQLDEEFEIMRYIVRRDDRNLFDNLDNVEAKRSFIEKMWQKYVPDEYAHAMTYRAIYLLRAKQADAQFPSVFRGGWKSDRGRVFIMYGPPTAIERFSSTAQTLPHQIWQYDSVRGQGGVEFVFVDQRGFNNYELVHTNLNGGEIRNEDWKESVIKGLDSDRLRIGF